ASGPGLVLRSRSGSTRAEDNGRTRPASAADRLKHEYGPAVKGIGFSGYHLGIAADIAAMTLGARWIERHFTLNRTWKGTDHAASLEAYELGQLVLDVRDAARALEYRRAELLPVEIEQREILKHTAK